MMTKVSFFVALALGCQLTCKMPFFCRIDKFKHNQSNEETL